MDDLPVPVAFDTAFNRYSVEDVYYNGHRSRILYSGHNAAAQSGIALDDPDFVLFDYNQRFMELLMGLVPRRVLVLGGGVFTLPRDIIKTIPGCKVDVVEIDGELVEVAEQYFGLRPDERLFIHIGDAGEFVKSSKEEYDAVIIDVFMHASIPSTFRTAEFFQDIQRRLHKDGVMAINVIGPLTGRQSSVIKELTAAMKKVFSEVQLFPARYGVSPWVSQNIVITGQSGKQDLEAFFRYPPVDLLEA